MCDPNVSVFFGLTVLGGLGGGVGVGDGVGVGVGDGVGVGVGDGVGVAIGVAGVDAL